MIFNTAGMFLQYLAPFTLLLAGLMSWLAKRRRTKLLNEADKRTSDAPLQQVSWQDFEQLVGAHFERLGFQVSFTGQGADGGIDLLAKKGNETYLVQCKQWRATQMGVKVVRELFGLIAARGATGGYVVSIGGFTKDASDFASGRNIELVNANDLLKSNHARAVIAATPNRSEHSAMPNCPKCGSDMVRRVAKQGPNAGNAFLRYSDYPRCRGSRSV